MQNETLIDGTSVFDNLASIESIGPVSLNATVVTSGNQNYSGTVTLVGDTTLVADGGEFSREIIGNGQDLTLNINNTITIEDGSGVNNLTSSGETILTGTINTTGSQTYQSNVTIEGDVTINAGGEVVFEGDVTGDDEIIYSSWATRAGGTGVDTGQSVSVLADGSSIVTGKFEGTATFGSTTFTSAGSYDVFVAKLDANGDYEWATQAGGISNDYGYDVSVLADGSSIVTGYFQDTATFGSTTFTSAGGYDVFVAKLDANGDYEWATQAGGISNDYVYDVSVLADGSSIVTGKFEGTATFGSTTFTSAGSYDVFVAKLDANGDYEWATQAGGISNDYGYGVSVLADGSSIVTGIFQDTATFGSTTFTSAGGNDVFVAKLDASGDYEWATRAGGTGHDNGHGVSVLADGSSIVTGSFTGNVTFGSTTLTSAGSNDVFVAKLDASGDYEWATQAGGIGNLAMSISVLADGSSIVTGTIFQDTATFGSTTFTSAGSYDVFVAKLDANGDYEWATQEGGTGNDYGYGVSVLADGSSIVTGYFQDTATFGNTTFTSAGSYDVFVAKLDASGNFGGIVIPDDADLTINTQADTTFGGTVSDLATLTTDAGGSTIAKADITTTGNQTYNDQFVLNTSLTLTGGNASFTGGIDGDGNDLTLNFTGNATLDGGATTISGINNLTSLGGVATNGTITTTGAQSFEGNATLIGNTTLVGPSATLAGTFEGQEHDLTINYTSPTTISSSGGNITNFTSVGDVLLNTTDFETIGSQTFQGNVTLTGDTMLKGTSGSFEKGLDGANNSLTLYYFNTTTIDGNSVFNNLNDLTSYGPVELNSTIQTAGNQSYLGTATLIGATEIQAAGGSFEGGLVGAGNDLTLNIANTITIADGSGVNNLTSVGETVLTGTINTTGSQTYQSDVTIEGDVTINAGGEVVFEGNVTGTPELAYSGWAVSAGGSANEYGQSIATFSDGSSVATGNFMQSAKFGNETVTSAGHKDIFITKLNSDGEFQWATREGHVTHDGGLAMSVIPDNSGNSIITGYINTPQVGNTPPTEGSGEEDIFIAKLDAQGNFLWKTTAGGVVYDRGHSLKALPDGSSIITGVFFGTATFGSLPSLTSVGLEDIFIAKVDADGEFVWARQAGGDSDQRRHDMGWSVDVLDDGSSIITGQYRKVAHFGDITLAPVGGNEIFVTKLNENGDFVWATSAGGRFSDISKSVAVFDDGSSVITGHFRQTATFGTIELNSTKDADGNDTDDVFVAQLNPQGAFVWAKQAGGGSNNDRSMSVVALS